MSLRLEEEGETYTNKERFRERVCIARCIHNEICSEWEDITGLTLYSAVERNSRKQPLISSKGIVGVYRCACFDEGEEK